MRYNHRPRSLSGLEPENMSTAFCVSLSPTPDLPTVFASDAFIEESRTGGAYHMSSGMPIVLILFRIFGDKPIVFSMSLCNSPTMVHCDVYSLGMILLVLSTGCNQWKSASFGDPTFYPYLHISS